MGFYWTKLCPGPYSDAGMPNLFFPLVAILECLEVGDPGCVPSFCHL